ncbi:hypothetical protein J3F83DRAFT_589953 [Trichoderma novae-zelandiae]
MGPSCLSAEAQSPVPCFHRRPSGRLIRSIRTRQTPVRLGGDGTATASIFCLRHPHLLESNLALNSPLPPCQVPTLTGLGLKISVAISPPRIISFDKRLLGIQQGSPHGTPASALYANQGPRWPRYIFLECFGLASRVVIEPIGWCPGAYLCLSAQTAKSIRSFLLRTPYIMQNHASLSPIPDSGRSSGQHPSSYHGKLR